MKKPKSKAKRKPKSSTLMQRLHAEVVELSKELNALSRDLDGVRDELRQVKRLDIDQLAHELLPLAKEIADASAHMIDILQRHVAGPYPLQRQP